MLARQRLERDTKPGSGKSVARATPRRAGAAAAALWLLPSIAAAAGEPVSFQRQVVPILNNHCLGCHSRGGQGYEASGLSMESYEELMKGTKYGPVIVPGNAMTSNLNVVVEGRADPKIRMPFHGLRLRPLLLDILRRWVDQGAENN